MAFNAKNLHYEKQEPAFLRKLRAENTSDRHNFSIARPRKLRLETGDDDGPTIVDERGENVTEKEYQDLLHGKTTDAAQLGDVPIAGNPDLNLENKGSLPEDEADNSLTASDKKASVVSSGPKKRKQGKAIGDEPEPAPLKAGHVCSETVVNDKPSTKLRSKKTKIKLSFDDPGN